MGQTFHSKFMLNISIAKIRLVLFEIIHIFIQMSSAEEAREVRLALHNSHWPESNPKTLTVQFDTQDNVSCIFAQKTNVDNQMERQFFPKLRMLSFQKVQSRVTNFAHNFLE